ETVNGLISGTGAAGNIQVTNGAATAGTLRLGNGDAAATYSGVLGDAGAGAAGTLSIVKIGAGTETLSGANNIHGGGTVSGGTLAFGSTSWSPATSQITVNSNGILDISAVTPSTLGVSSSITGSNGYITLPASASGATLVTSNLNAQGLTNILNISAVS